MKFLLVDDSVLMRERLKEMLSEFDGTEIVGEAENRSEVIESAQKLDPDVVIMDIQILDGDGLDIRQAIKADNQFPLVILLGNPSTRLYRMKCMYLGADFFFDRATEINRIPGVLRMLTLETPYCEAVA